MTRTVLFLYGTLKRGQPANPMLDGQEFVGATRTLPRYRLYVVSWHPGLVRDDADGLAVDDATLARLDEYEGTPDWFERGPIEVGGAFGPVEAYFFKGTLPPAALSGDEWPLPT